VNGEGGGRHGLHTDGGGAKADGQRREEAAYVQSGEAELLAKTYLGFSIGLAWKLHGEIL
jgi:hypothetical protein